MPETYHIRTYGCQMNERDSDGISDILQASGMRPARSIDEASVILFNTCCIRENADNKFYGQLSQLKSRKAEDPETLIAVAGCLAQKDREKIRERADFVDVVFGTHNVHRAAELLGHARKHGPIVEILEETAAMDMEAFPSAFSALSQGSNENDSLEDSASLPKYSAFVTIQIGCDNSCAFCIVPSVRGAEISRQSGDILNEVGLLADSGVSEITLLGQNVNSYGRDIALARRKAGQKTAGRKTRIRPLFAQLLREVGEVPGIKRVRFTSPHPKDLLEETIHAMAETPAVCEHLHLPLQSGSDRILKAMHRGYTSEKYLDRLNRAREAIPDLAVTTDIIVGFPGETEEDFERTLEVCAEASYDSAYTFIFSPRPGTEAAEMKDQFLPEEVVMERFERLRITTERSSLLRHKERVGRTEEVMVEGLSRRDSSMAGGRTRQNKLVHWPADSSLEKGDFAQVKITKAGAHYLSGDLLSVQKAESRRRIPVMAV